MKTFKTSAGEMKIGKVVVKINKCVYNFDNAYLYSSFYEGEERIIIRSADDRRTDALANLKADMISELNMYIN